MRSMLKKSLTAGTVAIALSAATMSSAYANGNQVLGAVVGAGAGTFIGGQMAGRNGAIAGAVVGAAVGAAVTSHGQYAYGPNRGHVANVAYGPAVAAQPFPVAQVPMYQSAPVYRAPISPIYQPVPQYQVLVYQRPVFQAPVYQQVPVYQAPVVYGPQQVVYPAPVQFIRPGWNGRGHHHHHRGFERHEHKGRHGW